jgi:flavin reductase (DIM6/NTAB) family NADH-FMN oxidoreductase RutF
MLTAMPIQQGIVGPIPEGQEPEEYDKLRRRVLWSMPSGLYVIGSRSGDRYNLMTANWASQVSFDPKLVAVSVEREALTYHLIMEGRVFTLNLISREDRAIVRKFVKPVEVDLEAKTLNGFPFHEGRTGTPILDQAVAYLECSVHETVSVGGHSIFVAEVVDAAFQQPEDTGVLRMEDTRMYYGG